MIILDKNKTSIFYIYELIDPRDGACFYVGKGHNDRYLSYEKHSCTEKRNSKLYNKIRKIKFCNLNILYNFPYRNLEEKEAYKLEEELIDFHGLQNLCNIFPGGTGNYRGMKHSEESLQKMSISSKNPSEKTRRKMSESQKNRWKSKELRKKMSEFHKGENNFMFGKTHTKEAKQKISEAERGNKYRLGKCHTEETKQKISRAHKGKHLSKETKLKMRKAWVIRKQKQFDAKL